MYKPVQTLIARLGLDKHDTRKISFYKPKGCERCSRLGYKGRVGICEILTLSPTIRDLILNRARESEIKQTARKESMKTLREDGIDNVLKGTTSLEEILRVTVPDE